MPSFADGKSFSGAFDVSFREGSLHKSNQFQKPANLRNPNHSMVVSGSPKSW